MNADRLRLVVVTPGRGDAASVRSAAAAALRGGATAVWVRERQRPDAELRALLLAVRAAARAEGGIVLVSSRDDLARELELDGVHLGFRDERPGAVRARLPSGVAVGFSAHDPLDRQAVQACDYATLSPVFPTTEKGVVQAPLGVARFAALCREIGHPVVALGGIHAGNAADVVRAGAAGVCVMRAVFDAADAERAARELRAAVDGAIP